MKTDRLNPLEDPIAMIVMSAPKLTSAIITATIHASAAAFGAVHLMTSIPKTRMNMGTEDSIALIIFTSGPWLVKLKLQ